MIARLRLLWEFRSLWRQIIPRPVIIVVTSLFILIIALFILGGYKLHWDWTGFNGNSKSGKTLWDWLQLLIIPFALTIIAIFFNRAERKNEQRIASDNQQEAALQAYIDSMSELMLHENLRKSAEDDEVRRIARVRTLTTLSRLDAYRKRSMLQFLYESVLIDKNKNIVTLFGADLSEADLRLANLREADLRDADLSYTNLREADLRGADLSYTDLRYADLRYADLRGADLSEASLSEAKLFGADLSEANLKGAIGVTVEEMKKQAKSLKGATMPDGSKYP